MVTKTDKKKIKPDWICFGCGNVNYSFRSKCNKCEYSKNESMDMHFVYMNHFSNERTRNDLNKIV